MPAAAHTLYAGQMLMGDVRWGTGINRYFLERNGLGELQAAVFVFTGGLEAGAFRMLWGPDSMLYVGMIGGRDDTDGYPKNLTARVDYGLQKFRYAPADTTFEMLAIRSRPAGFEIEFTLPVDSAAARSAASYTIEKYYMSPSSIYGAGSKQQPTILVPSDIQLSPDRRKVYLALGGLAPSTPTQMHVVHFTLGNFTSATGEFLWNREAWYTLNALGTGTPFDLPVSLAAPHSESRPSLGDLRWTIRQGRLDVEVSEGDRRHVRRVRVRDLRGNLLGDLRDAGSGVYSLPLDALSGGFAILEVTGTGVRFRKLVALP